jgi:hypothetical protein
VPADVTKTRSAARRRREDLRPTPLGRHPERAQLVWRRALELADRPARHDRFGLAFDLLRAAHHSPATMAHALHLGRNHLHAHPDDSFARGGVAVLQGAIACLGVKPPVGDITGAQQ